METSCEERDEEASVCLTAPTVLVEALSAHTVSNGNATGQGQPMQARAVRRGGGDSTDNVEGKLNK